MNLRSAAVRWVLLPALFVAVGFIAWWSYRTTRRLGEAAEQELLGATARITNEKTRQVEQLIILNDNLVNERVDPDELDRLETQWLESAGRISPTVRSVLVLDSNQRVVRHISRAGETDGARFRRLFLDRVLAELHLEAEPITSPPRGNHFHDVIDGRAVLVTYFTRDVGGRRFYVILEADLDYMRTVVFHTLEDREAHFNVTDEDGHLVYGRPLRGPSEFIVSHDIPTTLYKLRLSMAAPIAPERATLDRARLSAEAALVGLSLAALVAGMLFLTYAVRNERRLNQLKSDFIATVSHELKTPLSLIRMFGEMLATERVPSEAKRQQYLEIIVRESERLTALIENVLDFAKLERGKAAYEFHRANLGDVIVRGVEMFRYRVERERPALECDIAGQIPDSDLDERALQLLLFNLLDNALKYAGDSDKIIVRVRAASRALMLSVEDHGPGIPADDRKRIFERFYRGKEAGANGARGSGIGLALVAHIAEAHGGEVNVSDATPHGAIFTVTIPIRKRSERASRDQRDDDLPSAAV
jgi:two-component system phosphate regulon sensor histidine kinase PhoR